MTISSHNFPCCLLKKTHPKKKVTITDLKGKDGFLPNSFSIGYRISLNLGVDYIGMQCQDYRMERVESERFVVRQKGFMKMSWKERGLIMRERG